MVRIFLESDAADRARARERKSIVQLGRPVQDRRCVAEHRKFLAVGDVQGLGGLIWQEEVLIPVAFGDGDGEIAREFVAHRDAADGA